MTIYRSLFDASDGPAKPAEHATSVADHIADDSKMVATRTGEQLKREGMDRATWGKERLLAHARSIAYDVARGVLPHADGACRSDGLCTADDVYAAWQRDNEERKADGLPEVEWLGNGAGPMFSGNRQAWAPTGRTIKSIRPWAHANPIQVWQYVGGGRG